MARHERWSQIFAMCKDNNEVLVTNLVNELHVSEATIRRDLQEMEDLNLITRFHGGAKVSNNQFIEPRMALKSDLQSNSKTLVGRYAASLIKDNQMIYIDAGSSTYAMLNYITAKNITVVTIGVPHIMKLIDRNINTIVLGGRVRESTSAITGPQTLKQLDDYFFDSIFLGTNAIHEKNGLCTTNDFEAAVKTKAILRSNKTYVLADESKFNKIAPSVFAKFDQVTIISDGISDFDKNKFSYIIVNPQFNNKK